MEKQPITITGKDFQKIRQEIKKHSEKTPDKKIIFHSDNDELNRKVIEKEKIDVLLINQANKRDFQKQRNSGLNHIMARIAKKNNIKIGINLDEIIESNQTQKAKILARIRQNIKLCKKNKVYMEFIQNKYQKDIYDLKSLGLVLRMPTWMTKEL